MWLKQTDLHPQTVPRQSAVSLATAVGAAQRLDDLDEHGESQAVRAQAGAVFLFKAPGQEGKENSSCNKA